MKRKIVAFFCTVAILCACLCGTAFAAKKPSIELMSLDATWNGAMVTNPVICFRVNGNKTIKYARWYVTAYNRVDDKTSMSPTKILTMVGPLEPFYVERNNNYELKAQDNAAEDSPFKYY